VPQWCQREESEDLKRKAKPGQLESLSIKVDPQMKAALEKAARDEFTSVSSILKKAAAMYLQQVGIEWREEASTKK
jgi:hypothetical protein